MQRIRQALGVVLGLLVAVFGSGAGAAEAAAPAQIASITPANDTKDVSPSVTEIKVVFAQDMNTNGTSVCNNSKKPFPKSVGEPKWQGKRTLIIPVALEAGTSYELWLNSEKFQNFKLADGKILTPYCLRFTTSGEAKAQIASISPANGRKNVSPAETEITVVFAQDMNTTGMSIAKGKLPSPRMGKPMWTNKRTLVIPVWLEPGKSYEVWLNTETLQNFKLADGIALTPYCLQFTTAKQ